MAREPQTIVLTVGWEGELARIANILSKGTRDRRIVARPVLERIYRLAERDRAFISALAAGDAEKARARLEEIARKALERGVPPKNRPSVAKRKGGDARAWRNVRGKDALYKGVRADILDPSDPDAKG